MKKFHEKLININKKFTSNKKKYGLIQNELKFYRHFNKVFLSVKVTLVMMDHKIS